MVYVKKKKKPINFILKEKGKSNAIPEAKVT